MNLAIYVAALCDMCRQKWHQWMPFGCFTVDVAFTCHFMATHLPPTLLPYSSPGVIAYTSKNYLKWQAIQQAIYSIRSK